MFGLLLITDARYRTELITQIRFFLPDQPFFHLEYYVKTSQLFCFFNIRHFPLL